MTERWSQQIDGVYSLAGALQTDPHPGNLAAEIARIGAIDLEFYQPKGADGQKPHTRDEVYIIARGNGVLDRAGTKIAFSAGDVLFVAAHVDHRFAEFSDDFATWVIFMSS